MTKKFYPHVDLARAQGNSKLCADFGRLGGIRSGKKRTAAAESRKRLEALEAGTIASPKKLQTRKVQVTVTAPPQVSQSATDPAFDAVLEDIYRTETAAGARYHHMRNLAGVKQD